MMSIATLADSLKIMEPAPDEATGIDNFVSAWVDYFAEATVGGVKILKKELLTPAATAMTGAMAGINSGGGFSSIVAGITAFWGVITASAATLWVTVPPLATATLPPGLGGMTATLQLAGDANVNAMLGLEDCVKAIAAAIHPSNLGGLAVNTAVPPITVPIL